MGAGSWTMRSLILDWKWVWWRWVWVLVDLVVQVHNGCGVATELFVIVASAVGNVRCVVLVCS